MARLIQFLSITLILLTASLSQAQELSCEVQVNSRQVEGSERTMFTEMETEIFKFVNGRKWTSDEYEAHERIECSILINLTERVSANEFKGNIQVQASRPVYNSTFKSPLLNVRDQDFVIRYNQFEPVIYSETSYNGELASILSYYVYMILGYDYDSFSLEGGTKYFQTAQQIVNFAQASPQTGWKAPEDQNNRYWLVENALSARFKPLRKTYYDYHRKGYDAMQKDVTRARQAITKSLKPLRTIHNVAPSSYNMKAFFDAKLQEILELYGEASSQEKTQIADLLIVIDPANSNKYDKLRK
ncbi:MAG: DUF4835 family protein [Flavobacteriales bacterium]|nr:DUF4835 family protein [Flavobacteriales bacterium]